MTYGFCVRCVLHRRIYLLLACSFSSQAKSYNTRLLSAWPVLRVDPACDTSSCPVRLVVRMPGSQSGDAGSNPVRGTLGGLAELGLLRLPRKQVCQWHRGFKSLTHRCRSGKSWRSETVPSACLAGRPPVTRNGHGEVAESGLLRPPGKWVVLQGTWVQIPLSPPRWGSSVVRALPSHGRGRWIETSPHLGGMSSGARVPCSVLMLIPSRIATLNDCRGRQGQHAVSEIPVNPGWAPASLVLEG